MAPRASQWAGALRRCTCSSSVSPGRKAAGGRKKKRQILHFFLNCSRYNIIIRYLLLYFKRAAVQTVEDNPRALYLPSHVCLRRGLSSGLGLGLLHRTQASSDWSLHCFKVCILGSVASADHRGSGENKENIRTI